MFSFQQEKRPDPEKKVVFPSHDSEAGCGGAAERGAGADCRVDAAESGYGHEGGLQYPQFRRDDPLGPRARQFDGECGAVEREVAGAGGAVGAVVDRSGGGGSSGGAGKIGQERTESGGVIRWLAVSSLVMEGNVGLN